MRSYCPVEVIRRNLNAVTRPVSCNNSTSHLQTKNHNVKKRRINPGNTILKL